MLRATLALVLFCAPAALARDWAKAACEDDAASCQETCTIADGTQLDAQGRLERCLDRCKQDEQHCAFLRLEARRKQQQQISAPKAQVAADSAALPARMPAPAPPVIAAPGGPSPSAPPAPSSPAASPPSRPATFSPPQPALSTAPPPPPASSSSQRQATRLAIDRSFDSEATAPAPAPRPHPLAATQPPAELYTGSAQRPVVRAPDYDRLGSGPAAPAHPAVPVASTPSGSDTDALLDSHKAPPTKKKAKSRKDLSQWDPQDLE